MNKKSPTILKVVVIGDSGVGKTSLMRQYVSKLYSSQYKATIGADFLSKDVLIDGHLLTLQIWDTAGQERFSSLIGTSFWRGAEACILVYDVTNVDSFANLDRWKTSFLEMAEIPYDKGPDFPFLLVGNKIDLEDKRVIQKHSAAKWYDGDHLSPRILMDRGCRNKREARWCRETDPPIDYVEASAKEAINVDQAFHTLAQKALAKGKHTDISRREDLDDILPGKNLKLDMHKSSSSGCSC